jgi:hypothetical protein
MIHTPINGRGHCSLKRNLLFSVLLLAFCGTTSGATKGKGKDGNSVKGAAKGNGRTETGSNDPQELGKQGFKAMETGNLKLCAKKFRQAIKLDPTYSDYHTQVCLIWISRTICLACMTRGTTCSVLDLCNVQLATCLRGLGDRQEAIHEFETSISLMDVERNR